MLHAQSPAPAPGALSPLAQANDAFRRALGRTPATPGRFLMTHALAGMGEDFVAGALEMVRAHAHFPEGDDPHSEHDFGAFEHDGVRLFWKIDCFEDAACEFGADNPAEGCFRVLTVMLASDY
jgi:hypothetical protein